MSRVRWLNITFILGLAALAMVLAVACGSSDTAGGTGGYGGRSAYGGSGRYDCPCAHQPTDARRADARGGRRKK